MQKRRRFFTVLVFFWVTSSTYGQICSIDQLPANLQTGLRAYYPFCGNFQDISGNGYNGTSIGNVPFIADRKGTANAAIQGGGGYITTSNQFFRFTRSDTFTVSVWFTVPAAGCGGRLLSTESGEGHFRIAYYGNGAVAVQFGDYIIDTVSVNAWHHLVYVYANRNEQVYMDGALKLTNYETNTTEVLTYTTPFTIGAKAAPAYDLWCGNIDEVGVWRRALSDCEVKQLNRLPYTFSEPRFNEATDFFSPLLSVCGDSVELNAFATTCTYLWNTGDTTPSLTVRYSGEYKVTLTDSFGCKASDSIQVNLYAYDIIQNDTSICTGDSLILTIVDGKNEAEFYDFNTCLFADFVNTGGGGAASATVNGNLSCGLNLEWPAVVESNRKNFSYGTYSIDMRASINNARQYFTVLGRIEVESRQTGTDNAGYVITVDGQVVVNSTTHPAQYPNWYQLRVSVSPDSVIVWIGDVQVYAGKHTYYGPAPLAPIKIGTFSTSFYDNIRYTPYTPQRKIRWSTGDTTRSIVVRPASSTVYTVRVNNYLKCTDSVRVTVNGRETFNPLPDTLRQCSKSVLLNAGAGFSAYQWSNGSITPEIVADSTGYYRVKVSDSNGCRYADTVLVSLLNAAILQPDTSVCAGNTITLHIDSLFPGVLSNRAQTIPPSLFTFLQAYYPFSGNTNDYSKNNYTGYGFNVSLTTDRFGNPNSAVQFNGTDSRIYIPYVFFNNGWQDYTLSLWFSPDSHTGSTGPGQTLIGTLPRYAFTAGYSYNGSRRVYHSKNSNSVNPGWDILNVDPLNAGPMELGKWYHLIIVKRGLNYEYYLDGRLDKRVITTAAPAVEDCSLQLGAMMSDYSDFFNGKMDEVIIFDRALDSAQLQQLEIYTPRVTWSTGDTTKSITVTPDRTTTYSVTVSNGIASCSDSVTVSVSSIADFNPFPDTLSVCGDSLLLDAGAGFANYTWSTGQNLPVVSVKRTGEYAVAVQNAQGCRASDSVLVSLVNANIDQNDTTICKGASVKLSVISDTLNSPQGWQLLIPREQYQGLPFNFGYASFDPINSQLYSVLKNGGGSNVYRFDLTTKTVVVIPNTGGPGELYQHAYDFTNQRLLANRVGRDAVFALPLTGGAWVNTGNGGFDAENYGCAPFWNPISSRFAFFGGYGYFSVKNWVWESVPGGWINPYVNNNNCQPAKRNGQIARNKDGTRYYIFSGQGSCDGNQFAPTCATGSPWATDVGIYCWLKDLWELDLATYTFRNVLPLNEPSVKKEGSFSYDFDQNAFYLFGGYVPSPVYNPTYGAQTDFTNEVYRFRPGIDNGFTQINVKGTPPPIVRVNQYLGTSYYDSKYKRIIWARNDGIWALNLASDSLQQRIQWSTGDTTTQITVLPDTTTTYYVTVSNGITTCRDSVTVTVSGIKDFNPFPDTLCVCADSILLDAGPGFNSYEWSTGDTGQVITVRRKGWHKVSVTNESGCSAEDSVFIRRVFADILQNDTSLKALTPFELSIDTSYWSENGYRVYWSTGDTTTTINISPRQKTKYYVYVTDGFFMCKDSVTIDVKCIGGYNPCKSKLAVCDRSVVLDAGAGFASYYWSTGDTTQQITITSNGNYYVYVFDSSGAFGEDSAYVNLLAVTIQPRDTFICKGNAVQLVAGNLFNGNDLIQPTLAWSNGAQDTSITVTPLKTTKYYATLTNASNACSDSATVHVVEVDTSLLIIGDTALCAVAGDSIILQAGKGLAYQWLNNGIPINGANSRQYATQLPGNYAVIITDTLGCLDTSRIQRVDLNPLPTGTFLPPAKTTFCEGDSIFIAATGAYGYQWYRNGVLIPGATAAQYKVRQSGTYSVMYVSDKGCTAPGDTIQIQTSKKPDASFVFTTYCAGIASEFTSTSDTAGAGDVQYQWKFADGSTAGGPIVSHVFARSGNYPVQLILTSFDCVNFSDTATVVVRVQQPTPGIRYATINASVNVPVTLVARPLGSNYLWVPPDGLDNPRVRTPRLNPKQDAIYIITINNSAGCVTYDTLPVLVFDGRDIYVARGFTPNNDGKNDRLYPIAVGIVEIRYFRIYNRWGNLVFASSSLLPQDGWDGTYNGKAQPSDTFTWMVEGVDIEGKIIRKSGSSVLIR